MAASRAAARLAGAGDARPDPAQIAGAYSSERHIRIDGTPPDVWARLSGFFRSADGWVRTHGNYPHHAAALRRGLKLAPDADAEVVGRSLRELPAQVASREITAAGGLCVPVAPEHPAIDAELRQHTLVSIRRIGDAPARERTWGPADGPLRGIRVLDLTRVIAGPVATRTLALLGADVLRIDPPALREPEWQHLESGHGKRSALLDIASPEGGARFGALLESADVVVAGYRPTGLARIGLDPETLAARHPGLVIARLAAWGFGPDDAGRRGFDSLVQAASGIAWIESADGERPGALPAQALDHSAGYLLAAEIMSLLERQAAEGGTWVAETSLRRIAAELLGRDRTAEPEPPASTVPPRLQTFAVGGAEVTTVAPAISYPGGPRDFAPPRPWGGDEPSWP